MSEFCKNERHGGICVKTGTYCNLGACPYEQLEQFAPVVHGWWNANETCSLCGEKSTEGLDATIWNYWLPNYCPNCGAKMDGGEDNA